MGISRIYGRLKLSDKAVVLRFLERVSGYSHHTRRREHLSQLRRRLSEAEEIERQKHTAQERHDACAEAVEDAAARRLEADAAVEQHSAALVDAWQRHFEGLEQLRPADPDAALAALAEWVAVPVNGNPARGALLTAQQSASERFAARASAPTTSTTGNSTPSARRCWPNDYASNKVKIPLRRHPTTALPQHGWIGRARRCGNCWIFARTSRQANAPGSKLPWKPAAC